MSHRLIRASRIAVGNFSKRRERFLYRKLERRDWVPRALRVTPCLV